MKILFVSNLYTPNLQGGAERVVQAIAEGIVKRGHQAVVISAVPRKGARTDQVNGVKVYYVSLKNYYWPFGDTANPKMLKPLWHALDTYNPWMAREVARILDAERPDLVHTHVLTGFSPLTWQLVKHRGLPLVHTLHDYYLLCPRSRMFINGENCERICGRCRPFALPRRRLSRHVDAVVGVSRFVLERHLGSGYFATTPKKKIIHNTYPMESAVLPSEERSLPIRFGYLGRLVADKGLEMLLESVAQLPEGTWNLDVAGRGLAAYERYLHARYKASSIRFLGHVRPEVFFSEIDVLVVPSVWNDPSPRVFSEAYAHGVPVIGSRRGGIPELVEEGRSGFLFDPGCPADLTAKMRWYVDNPHVIPRMQLACRRKAESARPEDTVEQYLEVYTDVLRGA